jgi:hypothetical protein
MDQFLSLFGKVTISQVVTLLVAIIFLYQVWKKFKEYLTEKYEAEKEQHQNIQKVIEQAKSYPGWRQQSLDIQKQFVDAISELKEEQKQQAARLEKIENSNRKRELNKMFDRLLNGFQYYTSTEKNPMQAWTEMEASSFWNMFENYEELGGDGYAHTEIKPKMDMLTKIPMHETEKIAELMQSRK